MLKATSLVIVVSAFASALVTQSVLAQKASDADMAQSALESAFLTSDEVILDQQRQAADQRVATRAAEARGNTVTFSGTLVFNVGVPAQEVERLAAEYDFKVTRAESKLAVGQQGEVVTLSAGARDLLMLDHLPLAERLQFATGQLRYELYQTAISSESEEEGEGILDALKDPDPKFYKLTVVADMNAFAKLRELSEVAVVVVDETEDAARQHRVLARRISETKAGSPVTRQGSPFETSLPRPRRADEQ
jgi:hypothetical protein